ncbi:MAG: T9SS type A sorting domain-containing protein [Cyclobacteriaceae bacterium]
MTSNRKIFITVCLLCFAIVGRAQFSTWIVDNNLQAPTGSHIFSDLPAAIAAASAGDYIYVKGSNTEYASPVTIDKELNIIGETYDGLASSTGDITLQAGADGTRIRGLRINGTVFVGPTSLTASMSDIVVSHNFIERVEWNPNEPGANLSNFILEHNIIGSDIGTGNFTAIYIKNQISGFVSISQNVIFGSSNGAIRGAVTTHGSDITNNLFLGDGSQRAFDNVTNNNINFNIFFGRSPETYLSGSNNGFANNIAFQSTDDDFTKTYGTHGVNNDGNITGDPGLANIALSNIWDFETFNLSYSNGSTAESNAMGPDSAAFSQNGRWLPTIKSISGQTLVPEGSGLFLNVEAFIDAGIHDVPSLTNFEYFIYETDQGFGANLISSTTGETEIFSGQVYFETDLFSPGQYTIYLRVADENRWGHYKTFPIVIVDNAQLASDIDGFEYFFDTDPGVGLGTAISATRAANIDITETVASAGLGTGFHNFHIRPIDQHGRWGLPETHMVFVDNSVSGGSAVVQALEYFFDDDPGFGLANPLTVSTPLNEVDIVSAISTSSPLLLATGFHNLIIRAQDDGGNWGINLSKLVYIDPSGATDVANIQAAEYYLDTDPGYGLANAFTIPTPEDTIEIVDLIPTGSVSLGFHNLFMRVQDDGGRWSLPVSQLVFVNATGAAVVDEIVSFEYFFDDDPGYGNGTDLVPPAQGAAVDFTEPVNATGLSTGFHYLFIRAFDEGGTWGVPISKLVYVDPAAAGSVIPVQTAEYFFDDDPGYGAADQVDLTAAADIDELIVATANSLSVGFHNFYLRIQDASGRWSLPVTRAVYVDLSGNVFSNITELEYFFDTDPGFDQGTAIPISPSESEPIREVVVGASALGPGSHILGIRAKNEDNVWGLTEYEPFIAFPPSRELDSVSLIVFYNKTDGANWTQSTNWLTGRLDTWYGVTLANNRVDSIKLQGNNISGVIPPQLGYVDEATYLSLAENILKDTVPSTFEDFNQLVTLKLHANALNEITDISTISTLEALTLDSNYFDFGDLEALISISNISYQNQKVFGDFPVDSTVSVGQDVVIDKRIEGTNNDYQWYLNDDPIDFGDLIDHQILGFQSSDTGTYVLRVNNSVVSDLELETAPYHLRISDFEEDSLAMVSLFNALSGTSWTNSDNWLTGNLASWNGLMVESDRVVDLSLPGNNLDGKLPADLAYADSLINVNLSDNAIVDTIPNSLQKLNVLESLNVSDNRIKSIPALNNLTSLAVLDVSNNNLQFGDLEQNLGVPDFIYLGQDSVGLAADTVIDISSNLAINHSVSGANNTYQWLLNGSELSGETADEVLINDIAFADEGKYVLQVRNNLVSDLTLYTKAFDLKVSSLERDATALLALYDATGGDDWSTTVNWKSTDITTPWDGVQLTESRVTAIDLSGFGLKDTIPNKIREITSLVSADLANNDIAALPNMSGMPALSELNLDSNRFTFKYLIPNRNVNGISYANQKRFGAVFDTVLDAGEDALIDYFENVEFGSGSVYQWQFGELIPGKRSNDNVSPLNGANDKSLLIENVDINSQGTYALTVTNPLIDGLTLRSENQNVLAQTDFLGTVRLNGNPVTDAEVVVWRKTPSGPFVKEDSTTVNDSGEYLLEDVILGTFIVLARPNLGLSQYEYTIQTYYISSETYSQADELLLDGVTPGVDINLIDYTPPPVPGTATIGGEVISDFADDEGDGSSRVDGRRRVKKAGCAMRRFKAQGRPDQDELEDEISYYLETDDEGYFNFEQVADGKYLLTIEFPGIPLAEDAEVVFEIGGDRENQLFDVNVLITEAGIEVTQEEILYNLKPYIKDVMLYPNPTEGMLSMDYLVYRNIDDMRIQIVSGQGVILVDQAVDHRQGRHHAEVDLTNFESGIYYLIFTDEAGSFAHPVKVSRK